MTDIIEKLVASCDDNLIKDVRDKALILTGFASGGKGHSNHPNYSLLNPEYSIGSPHFHWVRL